MTSGTLCWLAIAGLLITAVAATGTKVLYEFSRHELEEYCRKRRRRDRFREILDRYERVALGVEALQIAGTTLLIATGTVWLASLGAGGSRPACMAAAGGLVIGTMILLVVTVWIPLAIVRLWSAPFLFNTWRMWHLVSQTLLPLAIGARLVDALMHRLAGRTPEPLDEEAFEDEIRTIVTEGLHDGLLEEDAREMIEGVIELGDTEVSDIMTSRSDITAMHVGLSWQQMLEFVIREGRTRIPVYDKTLDDVVGVLYVKDLLPEMAKEPGEPRRTLRHIVRKPWFVPKTKPVDDLLKEFQRTRNHLAVVVDEYMAVAGLVTIEDVLEEIVGEIVDEYDKDVEEEIEQIDPRTAEVLARAQVDEVNERLGLDLPEEDDFDTIGGFLISRLGHIPARDQQVQWQNVRMTVLEVSRRRIERVRIEVLEQPHRETA